MEEDGVVPYRLPKLRDSSDYISALQRARARVSQHLEKKHLRVRMFVPESARPTLASSSSGCSTAKRSQRSTRIGTAEIDRATSSYTDGGSSEHSFSHLVRTSAAPTQRSATIHLSRGRDIFIRRSPSSFTVPHSIDAVMTPVFNRHHASTPTSVHVVHLSGAQAASNHHRSFKSPDLRNVKRQLLPQQQEEYEMPTAPEATELQLTAEEGDSTEPSSATRESSAKSIHWGLMQSRNQTIDQLGTTRCQGTYSRGFMVHCKAPDSWLRRYRSSDEIRRQRALMPLLAQMHAQD